MYSKVEFKYEQNDKEWEMHAISPIAEVKYYKIRLSEKKEKVGIKLVFYCI